MLTAIKPLWDQSLRRLSPHWSPRQPLFPSLLVGQHTFEQLIRKWRESIQFTNEPCHYYSGVVVFYVDKFSDPVPTMATQALMLGQERTARSEGRRQSSSFAGQLRAAVKLQLWSGFYSLKNEARKTQGLVKDHRACLPPFSTEGKCHCIFHIC